KAADTAMPMPSTAADPSDAADQGQAADRHDERHLASLLVYAALCARRAGAPLERPGDDPTSDEWLTNDSYRAIWVRHTRPDGRKVPGPRPGTPAPERLITVDPRTILEADHWTDVFVEDGCARSDDPPDEGGASWSSDDPIPF